MPERAAYTIIVEEVAQPDVTLAYLKFFKSLRKNHSE